jgi:ABC-type multidrug transport system fused ATPase/permease subunit
MGRLREILRFVRPFWGLLTIGLALTGTLTVVAMAPPLLMRRLLNEVANEGRWGLFPLLVAGLILVPVLSAVVNIANSLTLNHVSLGIIGRVRKRMYRHLMRLSMRFYNETPVGGITQRLMGDVATISTVVTGGLITLITDAIAVGFAVVVMLRLSWPLSLLVFGLLPLYFLNYWLFAKRIGSSTSVIRSHMDHISSTLQERLSAHELIQAYGQEEAEAVHFSSQAKQLMNAAIRGAAYSTSFNQLSAFVNKVGNTVIYCAACYAFVKGRMGYGDVVAFCAYATQLLGPVVRFTAVANQLVQVGVSLDRVNEVLNRKPAIKESPEAKAVQTLHGEVAVDGVVFGYGGEEPSLKDVSLRIPAGTHLAIAGPAGSGRSTLAMLLRRFYDPETGHIAIDGTDIREYRLRDYRQALALVLPESTVFDGTIRENLCYGRPDATEERMVEVAKAVGFHDFVERLSKGYDTRVGTGGLKLSTGVRQQMGVARALVSEPLLLIVDEATASLDPDSASEVNQAIWDAMAGRTCIMIVNRVLMARDAEQVVVMHDGQIAEAGRHDELIAREGSLYRDLYGKQYGEHRLPPTVAD